jgi:hypothetical protein
MSLDSVFDVLEAGETAIVIFTRERQLVLRPDGTGYTGNWVVDLRRAYSRVVIYNRDKTEDAGGDVILATHVSTQASNEAGRCVVHFRDAVRRGRTAISWKEFADTGQNPVRYVEATEPADAADAASRRR